MERILTLDNTTPTHKQILMERILTQDNEFNKNIHEILPSNDHIEE